MFSTTYQKKILRGLRKRFGALSERSQRSQGELEAQLAALEMISASPSNAWKNNSETSIECSHSMDENWIANGKDGASVAE